LNRYRRELERALKGLGVGVPARRLVQDKLRQVLASRIPGLGSGPTASPACDHPQ
jgi:hypothetical protein